MKNKWIKYVTLFLVLTGTGTSVFAQFPERPPMEKRKREVPSPTNNAKRIVREFKKEFQLSDKEYDKVYDLYLKFEKSLIPGNANEFRRGMPPQGGMGMFPGGGPSGFGRPGMGMPPGEGFQPNGNFPGAEDMEAMMEEMRKEHEKKQEKASKTLKKKMKKILKGDQYLRWEEWEAKRKRQRPEPIR